jgi:uncharacterized RDD family membrane protein YckC
MTTARLAGFATRALALAVDIAIIDVVALVLTGAITWGANIVDVDFDPSGPLVAGLAVGGFLLILSVYLLVFWSLTGQTPGMRFMGIRVIDLRGRAPGLLRSLRRLAGFYLAALPAGAGFLLVLVDDRRRGLQDRVAATLVIHSARSARAAKPERIRRAAA